MTAGAEADDKVVAKSVIVKFCTCDEFAVVVKYWKGFSCGT